MVEIMRRAETEGLNALSLHELRIEYFRTQRAQRHGGGPYGKDDAQELHMERLLVAIRERVLARGGGIDLWVGDITTFPADVIVNAANKTLMGGGGVDGAIHRAAGPGLLEACRAIPQVGPSVRCPVGEARMTPAFDLPAHWVVHTVGPVWFGGEDGEAEALASAYHESLEAAAMVDAESIAFPALSTGAFGYPPFEAAGVAVETIRAWFRESESSMRVILVAFGPRIEASIRRALGGA